MHDPLTKLGRSALMGRIRSQGNRSTEEAVEAILTEEGISGWVKHPKGITGSPDFYFPDCQILLFVDGCFWHACPRCGRIPKSRIRFWSQKIEGNRRRDETTRRRLRGMGYHVVRVWEHAVGERSWLKRLADLESHSDRDPRPRAKSKQPLRQ